MLDPWDVISSFYEGLLYEFKMLLDSITNGAFLKLRAEEAEERIETIATNTSYWYKSHEAQKGRARTYEVSTNVDREAQMDDAMQRMAVKLE